MMKPVISLLWTEILFESSIKSHFAAFIFVIENKERKERKVLATGIIGGGGVWIFEFLPDFVHRRANYLGTLHYCPHVTA